MTTKNRQNNRPNPVAQHPKVVRSATEYRVVDKDTVALSFGGKSYKVKDGILDISAAEAEPFLRAGFLVYSATNESHVQQTVPNLFESNEIEG